MVQPIWKTVWQFFYKHTPTIKSSSHIPYQSFHPKELKPFVIQSLLLLLLLSQTQVTDRVSDSVTPYIDCSQAPLSSTVSSSVLKFMSTESVMISNHLILYCPLLFLPSIFPPSGSFPMSWLFASVGQSIGASASATDFPMNIQG